MSERCQYAYRKNGDNAVHCERIGGNMDYCASQYMCPDTKRWEAKGSSECKFIHADKKEALKK